MILGITGCPGSGKSALAAEIERHGWKLVDADAIGREVVENDKAVLSELVQVFGDDILSAEGKLLRRVLGRKAFADQDLTGKLNGIVHPKLIARLHEEVRDIRLEGVNGVVDCALIFEWNIQDIFDSVICITAEKHRRKERLFTRDGRTAEEIEKIFAAQLPEDEKALRADIVIKNNSSISVMAIYGKMFSLLSGLYPDSIKRQIMPESEKSGKGPLKILIVDDEVAIRELLYEVLRREGYSTKTADSGIMALSVIEEFKPHVVLLDIRMPDMDGLQCLRRIKENYPATEVLMISGFASREIAQKSLELGAYDYMDKPISLKHLRDILKLLKISKFAELT